MKARLFTPGPTPVPEETLLELAKPVTYHRAAEAKAILAEVSEDLKYVFQTSQPVFTITSSGTGGMEAAVANCARSRRESDSAHGWSLGRTLAWRPESIRGEHRHRGSALRQSGHARHARGGARSQPRHESRVRDTQRDKLPGGGGGGGGESVTMVEAFGKLVAKTDALLIVDGISGLGAMECKVDAWGIDVCVTGSQKALMLPPGLAFVSVSEKAWKKIDATPIRSFLLRPAAVQEVVCRERHAVHAGEHADSCSASESEAHSPPKASRTCGLVTRGSRLRAVRA